MLLHRDRLVSLLSMVAFLIANTPNSAVAMRCPWVSQPRLAAVPHTKCTAPCCHGTPDESPASADVPAVPRSSTCPYGCCWYSVAKVPCCTVVFTLTAPLVPIPESCLDDARLLLPPPHCMEMIRPPRA